MCMLSPMVKTTSAYEALTGACQCTMHCKSLTSCARTKAKSHISGISHHTHSCLERSSISNRVLLRSHYKKRTSFQTYQRQDDIQMSGSGATSACSFPILPLTLTSSLLHHYRNPNKYLHKHTTIAGLFYERRSWMLRMQPKNEIMTRYMLVIGGISYQ